MLPVDADLLSGLLSVMTNSKDYINKTFSEGSFAKLFLDGLLNEASAKDSRQFCWHPLTLKFAST